MGRHSQPKRKWASWLKSTAVLVFCLLLTGTLATLTVNSPRGSTDNVDLQMADDAKSHWTPVTTGLPGVGAHYGVYFGDVNNDGMLDVATQGGGMDVYTGDGLGSFEENSTGLPGGGGSTDIVLADFNNDGNLDIAGMGVYVGNGGEGGSMSWTYDSNPGSWNAVTAADVNLDGKMDVVAGTGSNGVHAWTGDGGVGGSIVWTDSSEDLPASGNFWGVKVGDINHDGKPDIVCGAYDGGVRAWTGNGLTGAASLWTDAYTGTGLPASGVYGAVDLGDVNNDGNLDIVSTSLYDSLGVRVWLGNGGAGGSMVWTEAFTGLDTSSNRFLGVSLADVDNDGDLDIFAAHEAGGGLRLWLGDGGAGGSMDWTEVSNGLPSGDYIDVDAGDYNNDGKMDFVASRYQGVEVWQNDRLGFLIDSYVSASVNLPNANEWSDVQMADVNHDGKLDIGFSSFPGQNLGIKVFLGDGTGVWTDSSTGLPANGGFNALRFGDINHDGALDIVSAQNGGNNGIHVWSGDGTGTWTEMAQVTSRSGSGLELADTNNDGDLDVVTGYHDPGFDWGPMIFLGDGSFGWTGNLGPAGETIDVDDVAVGDVNHDGKPDIAASSMDQVGIQLWTGDGSGSSTGWERNDTGLPTTGVHLGITFADVNRDGNPDLAAAGFAGGELGMYAWLGNGGVGGSMSWTPANTGLPVAGQYGGVEFGDTNLDGDMDLVFAATQAGGIGIGYTRGNGGDGGPVVWTDPGVSGIPTTGTHWGVAFGDMDNDGILDIAATSTTGVRVYKQGSPPLQPPQVTVSFPDGLQNWTGNTLHTIWWNLTDNSPNDSLLVYLNYSYNGGSSTGTIVGPIAGTANPNSYGWTTPSIDASDVVVNVSVVDPDGIARWDGGSVSDIDSNPPSIVFTSPADTATGVPIDQPLIIQYSESMNRNTAVSAFSISPDPLGWSWSWSSSVFPDDNMTSGHAPFLNGQTYDVTILQTAIDASSPGNILDGPYTFSFTAETINVPPTITVDSPLGGESWTGGSNHAVSFTASDNEDAPSSLLVWLNYSLTGSPPWSPIAGPISGDLSPAVWTLPGADTTNAYVRAEVLDTRGGTGWDVSGPFEVDSFPPSVTDTTPLPLATNVPVNMNIVGVWNEPMDTTSTELSFSLEDPTGTLVAGIFSWSGGDTAITFDPGADLLTDSWYTANFTTVARDDSDPGNNLPNLFSWIFRTASAPDTTPPRIENVSVAPSPVEVFFNVNIAANIFDDFGLSDARVEIIPPVGSTSNESMTISSGNRYYRQSLCLVVGTYDYVISAVDTTGNWNETSGQYDCVDTFPPTITDLRDEPDPAEIDEYVNVSAIIVDAYQLDGVWISIVNPDMQESNYTMISLARHYFNQSYSIPGTYDFTIWASDSYDNWASATGDFEVLEPTVTAGYVSIVYPEEEQQVIPGEVIFVRGWVNEIITSEGMPGVELVIRLETLDGMPIGSRAYTVTGDNGNIFTTFVISEDVTCGSEYIFRVYSNETHISENSIVLTAQDCHHTPPSIWLWLIIIIIVVTVVLVLVLFLVLRKKKREEETVPPQPEQPEAERSDNIEP